MRLKVTQLTEEEVKNKLFEDDNIFIIISNHGFSGNLLPLRDQSIASILTSFKKGYAFIKIEEVDK